MRAVIAETLDGPEGLRLVDLPEPTASPGEVIIDVAGCALNFMDTLITRGRYQIKPELPFSPGAEVSGRISALGAGVDTFEIGERVMAYVGYNGARERVAVAAGRLVRVPKTLDLHLAAGLTVTYGTALYALKTRAGLGGALHDEHRMRPPIVAVLGASGGAGLAAVEVAQALGAEVIACASSQARADIARQHGANTTLAYGEDDLKTQLRALTDGVGPNIVYDCIGGDYAEAALRALAPGGEYLVIGFAAGDIPSLPANIVLLKDCNVRGIHWGASVEAAPTLHRDNMAELVELIVAGRITPRAPDLRPLEAAADAISDIAARKTIGKIVLTT